MSRNIYTTGNHYAALHKPINWRVVGIGGESDRYAVWNVDGHELVNPIRVVCHVNDGVRDGIEYSIAAIATRAHLGHPTCVNTNCRRNIQSGQTLLEENFIAIASVLKRIPILCTIQVILKNNMRSWKP